MGWYFLGLALLGIAITTNGLHDWVKGGTYRVLRRVLEGLEFLWAVIAVILLNALLGWNPVALACGALMLHFLISAALSTLVDTRLRTGIDAFYPKWFSVLEVLLGLLIFLPTALYILPEWV